MPSVGWDGRDVSGLSHEQIHRWTRDGASPEALAAARDRHLARADELRAAADRLQAAHRGVGETWVGRDADAAGARTRVLAERMEQLARTVGGQARSIDGLRAALVRVQAAVGPPRPPALPALGVTPVLEELRALVTGHPADGYAGFRSAAADQAAAREAYRAYLGETATAARAVEPAGAGPTPAPGAAARGRPPLPVGARGAASGVLQRAAGAVDPVPTSGVGARPATVRPGAGREVPVRGASAPVAGHAGRAARGGASASGVGAGGTPGGGAAGGGVAGSGVARGGAGGGGARVGAGSSVGGPGPGAAPAASTGGQVGGLPGGSTTVVGAPGPRGAGPAPIRRPDGRVQRAPSALGGPPGPPRVFADHRPGRGAADFGPDAAPSAADEPETSDEGAEEPVVPVSHVSWLVDPAPAGWGAAGRRVVPPVLGEDP